MIERLGIRNFAIIDSIDLDFSKGFSVFTGETGAGKSIIVGALTLLMGERGDANVVRSGTDKAMLEAEFSVSNKQTQDKLAELGVENTDSIIIRREISANGKSRGFINGVQEPISRLAEIGEWLVDIHGQHDHQLLLSQKVHIDILDNYGKLMGERVKAGEKYEALMSLLDSRGKLELDEEKMAAEKIYWETAIIDMEKAAFTDDEEKELREHIKLMENSELIATRLESAYFKLYDDELAVSVRMTKSIEELSGIRELDTRYGELLEILEDASAKIDESVNLITQYRNQMGYDTDTMDELTDRLQLITDMKRKYKKNSTGELNAYAEECAEKLARFENRAEELAKLEEDIETAKSTLIEYSLELSKKRQNVAKELADSIQAELAYLGMDKSVFVADIKYVRDEESPININGLDIRVSRIGIDRVEFLISSNVGEEARPLRKVASGGEISRVMLALKAILAHDDLIETLIFDEIDVGIGGVTANNVGEKMRTLSAEKQLLSITHLPQIAGKGDVHYVVSKSVDAGKTFSTVKRLSEEERVEEIARMLGGESDTSLAHAKEILGR